MVQTRDEILAAEKAVDDRIGHRNRGFRLAKDERDVGWRRFSNGVTMLWHVNKPEIADLDEGEVYLYPEGCGVPEGTFVLKVNGKRLAFDAEEFRRALRWV
jgi:hypothetical protein